MNLVKSSAALAVLTVFSSTALANNEFYGKANVTVQLSDEGDGSFTEVKSNASRLGVNSHYEVNDDLKVIVKFEVQVDVDGEGDENISGRNQYVGLEGGFGKLVLGKNDTVTKQSQGKVDLFNDMEGDIKNIFQGENRLRDTVTYKTPKFGEFQLGLTYVTNGSANEDDEGVSAALFYGDNQLKKTDWFASVAMDRDVKGYDVNRATVSTKLAGIVLGAMIQNQENLDSGEELDGYFVSAKYTIENWDLKGQFQQGSYELEDTGVTTSDDATGYTVGVDYKIAKNAKIMAFYTDYKFDDATDRNYFGTGIEYKF
ncbi:porin [Thalassotalea litorea]|uniref:porin n=1 Tax=Thalassotalea litorea TaxID=2020715 RepID=UPI0037354580